MGQKGSKDWTEGGFDSTLVDALVEDQISRGEGADLEDTRKPATSRSKYSIGDSKNACEKKSDGVESDIDTPVPKVQSLFAHESLENSEDRNKPKKKSKQKKADSKRQAPKRRRSTRVAPCSSWADDDVSLEDNPSVQTSSVGIFQGQFVKKGLKEQVCIEVDDDTNESMESETESLTMKSPSDNESVKDGAAVTQITVGGAVSAEPTKTSRIMQLREPLEETPDDKFMTPLQLFNSMNDGQLSPYLFDPNRLLIMDIREEEMYRESHILTAIHLSELEKTDKITNLGSYTIILLYDANGLTYSLTDSTMSSLMNKLTRRKYSPSILKGGFDEFSRLYSFLCTDKLIKTGRQRAQLLVQYPTEILPQRLYLGRGEQATDETIIKNLGITHIVNISMEHQEKFSDWPTMKYLTLKLPDESSANLFEKFQDINKFVGDALLDGGRSLIHCNLGQSRSATAVIAFLMATKGWNLNDAFFYVKERRPIIAPNRGFLQQLAQLEEEIIGENISDPHELWK